MNPFAVPQVDASTTTEQVDASSETDSQEFQALSADKSVTTPLTTLIRQRILDGINNSADNVAKFHDEKQRSQEAGESSPIDVAIETQQRVKGQIAKTVRSTFAAIMLSIGLSLGGAFFITHELHGFIQHAICGLLVSSPLLLTSAKFRSSFATGATLVELAVISQLSTIFHVQWRWFLVVIAFVLAMQAPLWLALSIWKSVQLQKLSERAIKEAVRETINDVLSEAHFISANKRLERRLREFDDWEQIIGLVAHKPYSLNQVSLTSSQVPNFGFPSSVAYGTAHLANEDVVRIASDFRRILFAPGWLNERFVQLREPLIEEMYVKLGISRENGVVLLEGDTSSDMQAPRKIFRESLLEAIQSQTSAPVVERLDSHLRTSSISALVDHIEFHSNDGSAVEISSIQFLDGDLAVSGSLLPSHWRENLRKDSAEISRNMRFGDTSRMHLRDESDGGIPKVIVGAVQLTERLSPTLLACFEKDDD